MVRIGIIGLGWMGQLHAQYLKFVRNAKLTAVCDKDQKVLNAVAQKYDVMKFENYNELIDCDEIDAVYIVTPQKYHYEILKSAIASGKHILCEKPLALTRDEIFEIRKMAKNSK